MDAMESARVQSLAERLDAVFVDEARVRDDLHAYFVDPDTALRYTGRHLTTLFGGGDRPAVAYLIAPEDLIAVEMLGVRMPPATSLQLLEGELGRALSSQLRDLPIRASIFDPYSAEFLDDDGPADRACRLLNREAGVDVSAAARLLARKRAALVPVYDDVVSCALGEPETLWPSLHAVMCDPARGWDQRLTGLRAAAEVSDRIPPLRVLDATIWMSHAADHERGGCAFES
jgi:hypothetical protein